MREKKNRPREILVNRRLNLKTQQGRIEITGERLIKAERTILHGLNMKSGHKQAVSMPIEDVKTVLDILMGTRLYLSTPRGEKYDAPLFSGYEIEGRTLIINFPEISTLYINEVLNLE